MVQPVRLAVVGAGARGRAYARLAGERGAVVAAVAEPDPTRRALLAAEHGIGAEACFPDWTDLLSAGVGVDAVVIATQDRLHVGPAIACARAGYHLLLEKPMAPTEEESAAIVRAVEEAGVLLAVGHVMRYSPYTQAIKRLVARGALGDIVSVEHLEPVGWWHFAHSYVRGNWATEAQSSSMLLAKACHDLDWVFYMVDQPVRKVSSFGSLSYFRPENRPAGAADRCVDCPLRQTCAYSATLIYGRCLNDPGLQVWPLEVLTPVVTPQSVRQALELGPYGRCVFAGTNDVADHQVVSLEFDGGATASLTVCAFTALEFRKTRIFGTHGCLEGDGARIRVHDFLSDTLTTTDVCGPGGASAAEGHGGGDGGLITDFIAAVAAKDATKLKSSPRESLATHRLVWAAEQSRLTGATVTIEATEAA